MKQLPPLTGVRFIAVVMIFLYHYNRLDYGFYLQAVFNQFYLGVSMFFVLSGFLIRYNYGKEVRLDMFFLKRYYINRVARIIPLYYVLLTFTFIILYFRQEGGGHLLGIYFLNLSFIKGFSRWYMFTGIYPAWSLTPEVTFYVLFPLISWLITRFGWWWQQVVFFWAVGALLYLFFHFFPFRGFFPDFAFVIMATFFGRCLEFFAGMLLADCFIRHQAKTGRPERDGSVPLYTLGGGVIILAVIIIGAMLSPNAAMANRPVGLVLSTFVFPVGIASFLYGLVTETTWTGRLLSTQLFQVFGKGAYAFFLVHSGFIAGWLFDVWNGNQFLFFISLLFVSILLYYFIERPLNKWIKTKGIRQEVPMPAP